MSKRNIVLEKIQCISFIVCERKGEKQMISEKYMMIQFLYNINDLKNLKSLFKYGIFSKMI